jgi:uncharacterized membrane protein YjgN (DUF898 family)
MNEKNSLSYHGEGGALLWLYVRCIFLSVITLGIYWSWAKARILRYHYENTSFGGSPMGFQGTGTEIFIGALKGLGILALILVPYVIALVIFSQRTMAGDPVTGMVALVIGLILYIGLIIVVSPIAINSSMRYRFGRTSWRSIRWGYTGKNRELLPLFVKGFLLTMVTFGIYGSWFNARYYRYVYSKLHFGSVRFRFKGEGKELFFIGLKGLLLSIVTLGIYLFWYLRNVYRWLYENMEVLQGGKSVPLKVDMTGGQLFVLNLTNLLLLVFTLGIAAPWVNIRSIRFVMNHISAAEDLDTDAIEQIPASEATATGDDLADFLDLGDWGIL